jgi:hypothetical protein
MSQCKQSCAPTVSIEACKGYGTQAGKDAAKFACDLTLVSCQQPKTAARCTVL